MSQRAMLRHRFRVQQLEKFDSAVVCDGAEAMRLAGSKCLAHNYKSLRRSAGIAERNTGKAPDVRHVFANCAIELTLARETTVMASG